MFVRFFDGDPGMPRGLITRPGALLRPVASGAEPDARDGNEDGRARRSRDSRPRQRSGDSPGMATAGLRMILLVILPRFFTWGLQAPAKEGIPAEDDGMDS